MYNTPGFRLHAAAHIMLTQAADCRYTGHTLAKFFVTSATGLVTGLTAAACAATLEFVFARKQQAVQYMIDVIHHQTLYAAFGLHLLITTALLMFAACLVCVAQSCHLTPMSFTHACTMQTCLPVNLADAPDTCTTFVSCSFSNCSACVNTPKKSASKLPQVFACAWLSQT